MNMRHSNTGDLEKEFEQRQPLIEGFAARLRELVSELLSAENVSIHVVESRAKSKESFIEKIQRPGKKYKKPLQEVTDLIGCRVICYYRDDCRRVAEIISREFEIREEELSYQPEKLDVDRFGYLSAHYIVSLNPTRAALPEWSTYSDLIAEIQVRTVIQHAWSAVSHALQYKVETSVASSLQRRLNRLAGLFELADDEFVGIRDQREHERKLAAEAIESGEIVALTPTTVQQFLESWSGAEALVKQAKKAGFVVASEDFDQIDSIVKLANHGNLEQIQQLKDILSGNHKEILESIWNHQGNVWQVDLDFICVLILIYKLRNSLDVEFLSNIGFHESIANEVLKGIDAHEKKN